jgi:dienelactone hydrolase
MRAGTRRSVHSLAMPDVLDGWSERAFVHDGIAHRVYRRGAGPGVIVMHEIPGITPPVAAFANRVADAGFTVLLPWMFGQVGRPKTPAYSTAQIARACVSREFRVFESRGSSPIVDWLRALARELHAELGGPGVGAVGMCITGNFALAMCVEATMMAPVLSQPSLPFPIGSERRRGLHVSADALATIKDRCAKTNLRVLGLRFTEDPTVPGERFAHLRRELGPAFEAIEIDSSRGNPHRIARSAHSVLTQDLVDREGHPTRAALDRVLAFFGERLRA